MNVLQVVAGVEEGGGIGKSVPLLCSYLAKGGQRVTLATLDYSVSKAAFDAEKEGVCLALMKRSRPYALWFSFQLMTRLPALVRSADVVHVHSNWTFPVWWGCLLALYFRKTLVMSPRGCLDPVRLNHSRWKKRLVGWIDRWLLRRASVIHATCEAENAWIRAFLKLETGNLKLRPKIVVIPNGIETF